MKKRKRFVYDDGGRKAAGFKGEARDCVCRAISIATEMPYRDVYNLINRFAEHESVGMNKGHKRSNARTGVYKPLIREIMASLGWTWVPTMFVGSGCRVHLKKSELPPGRLVVNVSRHSVAVIDGVIHDTHDCSRGGTRCVYGYFIKKEEL